MINRLNTPSSIEIAVLFLVFNRPDTTRQVFEAIKKAKPTRLYVATDGPRKSRPSEVELVEQVRQIATNVDWDCKVNTLFRNQNLGCREAVSGAIDWFFEKEVEGIILEDDCLPDQSFFWYCKELLDYYRDDTRVMAISGSNFQQGLRRTDDSYYFSRYNHCWGWASWKRSWALYDKDLCLWSEFKKRKYLKVLGGDNSLFVRYWTDIFDRCYRNEIDSWAYRWTFSCWANGGLTCLPVINLVKNIGFGDDSTHTKSGANYVNNLPLHQIQFPLAHPPFFIRDCKADLFTDRTHFGITRSTILKRELINAIPALKFIGPGYRWLRTRVSS